MHIILNPRVHKSFLTKALVPFIEFDEYVVESHYDPAKTQQGQQVILHF